MTFSKWCCMKYSFFSIGCVLLFFVMLTQPEISFKGAQNGLQLWFQVLVPTLLPFMIVTNILFQTNGISYITYAASPVLSRLFRTSQKGGFACITGFLCGYPMGAKVIGDLCRNQDITTKEGQYLLSFCNNTSPAFVSNYICWKILNCSERIVPSICILFLTPVILSFLFRKIHTISDNDHIADSSDRTKHRLQSAAIIDHCILNAFESVFKIGGYMVLFSIFFLILGKIKLFQSFYGMCMLASLEITNGIFLLSNYEDPIRYAITMGITSFGGICSIAQTASMLKGTDLKLSYYIIEKLVTALATSFIAYIYLILFK